MDQVHPGRKLTRGREATSAVASISSLEPVALNEVDWLKLWHQFIDVDVRHVWAHLTYDREKSMVRAEYPDQHIPLWSVSVGWPGKVVREGAMPVGWSGETKSALELTRDSIEVHYDQEVASDLVNGSPALIAEGEDYRGKTIAAFDRWEQQCKVIDARQGLPVLEESERAMHALLEAAEAEIINTPATDMTGVAVKLALWRRYAEEELEHYPELLSAWRDAQRIAGLGEEIGMLADE